jgi:quercetin dioxygenase-like cupin family protein
MSVRIRRLAEEPGEDLEDEEFSGVNNIWLVLKKKDFDAFSSRIFRMNPTAHTTMHEHDREHIGVVLRGRVGFETPGEKYELTEGSIITIPPMVPHRFSNPTRIRSVLLLMNFFKEESHEEVLEEESEEMEEEK